VAVIVATAALFLTALHLITPRLPVSERTLAVARTWLVSQQQMADFSVLAADSAWRGRRLRDLLTHVELAGYNRGLVNWTVDEQVYREFVLSPNIAPACDGQLDWRRELWEHFYPLIRREMDMEPAARLVLDKLHGSMKVSAAIASGSISEAWQRGQASPAGMAALSVATLRAVGITARNAEANHAEYWNGANWVSISSSNLKP
jgi:hypothetical protein